MRAEHRSGDHLLPDPKASG